MVGLLTLYVSKLVQRPRDEQYPFGYATFEPMLNLFKGIGDAAQAGPTVRVPDRPPPHGSGDRGACGAYTPEIGDASVDANAASLADHAETAFGTRPVGDTKRRPDRP